LLAQFRILGVEEPFALLLDLGRDGELVVFLGQALAVFSTMRPMLIRPSTGGVIASPLIMG